MFFVRIIFFVDFSLKALFFRRCYSFGQMHHNGLALGEEADLASLIFNSKH
jgi:hypothetical protein